MHRRDFSRSLITAGAAAAGWGLTPALAQRVSFQEGKDFVRLAKPVPSSSPMGQVEVVEFFSYSCIHCYHFEPVFNTWIQKKPAHVTVRRMHVAFSQDFVPLQRLYFTLEAMGLVDTLHEKVFKAIHVERLALTTPPTILAWVEKQGVNRDQFNTIFNGAAVKQGEKAMGLQDAYQVEATPALGVGGRFYVGGQGPRTLLVADYLVAETRKG